MNKDLDLTPVEKKVMLIFHRKKQGGKLLLLGATELKNEYTRLGKDDLEKHITRQRAHAILAKMEEKDILRRIERKGFTLSEYGERVLIEFEHRFKILETYCYDELEMDIKSSENEAIALLLHVSHDFIAKLCKKMGKPISCPHNVKIPHDQ